MPNRLIPDFSRDEKFNKLSLLAESFFRRLWNKADDFGRYDARPLILKADLFPLRDVRIPDIVRSLKECETADLLVCYQAENGEYLQLKNFNQRVRAMKSIYPPMPDSCQTDVRQMSDNRLLEEEVEVEEEIKGDKSPVLDFNSILSFSDSKAFTNAWDNWVAYRREKKLAKWTESTIKAKAKIFEEWGEAKTIQSIEQSIANGWQGLFEVKEPKDKKEDIRRRINGNEKLFKELFDARESHFLGDYGNDPISFDDWSYSDVVVDEIADVPFSASAKIYKKYAR